MPSIYHRANELLAEARAAEREGNADLGRKLRLASKAEHDRVWDAQKAERVARAEAYRRANPLQPKQ